MILIYYHLSFEIPAQTFEVWVYWHSYIAIKMAALSVSPDSHMLWNDWKRCACGGIIGSTHCWKLYIKPRTTCYAAAPIIKNFFIAKLEHDRGSPWRCHCLWERSFSVLRHCCCLSNTPSGRETSSETFCALYQFNSTWATAGRLASGYINLHAPFACKKSPSIFL